MQYTDGIQGLNYDRRRRRSGIDPHLSRMQARKDRDHADRRLHVLLPVRGLRDAVET